MSSMQYSAPVFWREAGRRYADEGRLRALAWFVSISAGIAALEWSLSPQIAYLWLPHDLGPYISDRTYFTILFVLASAWIVVVAAGIYKCGWPALVMLTYAKWGLFPLYFWILVLWSCVHGSCL